MEKFILKLKKARILFFIALLVLLSYFTFFAFAYSPYYTHPDLTEEIAKLWNLKNSNQKLEISQNEIQWMRQGAIDEDKPARWINHFYDPIHKTGWSGKHFGTLSQKDGLYQGESIAPKSAIASIDWATNQEYQSAYGRQFGNQTWQKALKSYIDGDKKSAFIALGHILHLIEDASVPDHTRDDTHADLYGDPGSPYEKYSKEYTNFNKLNIAENSKDKELFNFATIQDAFNYVANYSNNNFFSADTISNKEYAKPDLNNLEKKSEIIGEDKFIFLYDNNIQTYLAFFDKNKNKYSTNDKSFILPLYFTHLAPQAVLTGASVMNLFFQEVEKYKKNPELLPEIIHDSNESIVSYIGKAPYLAVVNVADRCDKITTDYQINGGIMNIGKEAGCSAILGVAGVVDKTITNAQKIGIFAQGIIGNIASIFPRSKADIFSMTANIGPSTGVATNLGDQGANQTESRIANQESRILNQSAEVEPPNSKEDVQPQNAGSIPSIAEEVQPQKRETKQSEIIHAPYQWPKTETKTEIIHAPYQGANNSTNNSTNNSVGNGKSELVYKDNSPSHFENQQTSEISLVSSGFASSDTSSSDQPAISGEQANTATPSSGATISPPHATTPSTDIAASSSNTITSAPDTALPDIIPPEKPIITTNNGADFMITKFASQYPERKISFTLEGTKSKDASGILINNSSENVIYPTETGWKKDFVLPEGDSVFQIKAKDAAGNISDPTTIKITLQFSDVKFYLTNYDVRKFNFTLNWQDSLSAAQSWELQYKLGPNFDWADISTKNNQGGQTANSYDFTAQYDDLTYYFRLRGKDTSGNMTDWQYLQADISTKPVVINEVAWMGTQASANDEWMELANKTDQEIDLKGWTLKTSDGGISIVLSGKISPDGFYLLERTNDDPVKNIQADQIYTGALRNPGMYDYGQLLQLSDVKGDSIDDTYAAFVGDNASKKTAERISIWASGMEKKNWKTHIGTGGEAQDASGNKIFGTPKAKNSQADSYYYLPTSFSIDKDEIFLRNKGPYISDNLINISQPATLNIEPGTVLKFGYLGGLDIYGRLQAKGTAENKIIFTSSDDDGYGGDTNSDGQTAIVNWRKFAFNSGSSGEINNSLFRYAGNVWTTDNEVFHIVKAGVKIYGSIFENMGKDVLHFENSDADISASEFKNNSSNAVYIYGGKGDISGNVFDNNKGVGVYVGDPAGRINISGNSFVKNKAPIRLDNFGDFGIDLNQVSNNDYNGVIVYASSLDAGNILLSADMPFVIMGFPTIQSGATLKVAAGSIIKFDITNFHGMTVNGTLKAVGTSEKPIVFTSLYDDQYGGDTNNDSAATSPRSGLWAWMDFAGSENSTLENVVIKYGSASRQSMGGPVVGGSAVYVDAAAKNFVLRNSRISDDVNGAIIYSDGAIVENSSFSGNSDNALSVFAKNVSISNVTFNDNKTAILSDPATMASILLTNLTFNANINNFWPVDLIANN